MDERTRDRLIEWAVTYNDRKYFTEDPIAFPRHFAENYASGNCGLADVEIAREFDTLKSKIFDRVRSELFFLSNLFSIFVVYISKYCKYETCN